MRLALIVCISTVGGTFGVASASSIGGTCKKVGATTTVRGLSLTCTRKGKRTVWAKSPNRAVSVSGPTTTTTEVLFESPTGWSDLETRAAAVPYAAWKSALAAISGSDSPIPTVQYLTGSNVVITNSNPLTGIGLASKLFSSAPQPTNITLLRFGFGDVEWAQSQWTDVFGAQDSSASVEVAQGCRTATSCWGGVARLTNTGSGWIALSTMEANRSSSRHTNGALEAHEYVHLIQGSPFVGVTGRTYAHLPRWLLEGMATWAQAAILGEKGFDAYKAERRSETSGFRYGVEWIEGFLKPTGTNWIPWNNYTGEDSWRVYDVGLLATEILVALKGPRVVMRLYQEVARGQTFDEAFQSLYGLAWQDAYKIMARVIASQIQK